ncbi:MAG: hydrogenase formation protein HypD, partial [bacterium]
AKSGLRARLPKWIRLVSGPGCPVCVTSISDLDKAIILSQRDDVIIATYGDMIRVPGSCSSLQVERAKGNQIKVVYSSHDALRLAYEHKDKKIIFLGIGFETTAPTIASTVLRAKEEKIKNFFLLSLHKLVPPALQALLTSKELEIDGFILPGHVSAIIGADVYRFISTKYKIPGVIAGFEINDILQAIVMLVKQVVEARAEVEIGYRRVVTDQGNIIAKKKMALVFRIKDANWRGIGIIPDSGLSLNDEYAEFDVDKQFEVKETNLGQAESDCICGNILRGVKTPLDCPLFSSTCVPDSPVGPCMVSSEGTCAAYYFQRT